MKKRILTRLDAILPIMAIVISIALGAGVMAAKTTTQDITTETEPLIAMETAAEEKECVPLMLIPEPEQTVNLPDFQSKALALSWTNSNAYDNPSSKNETEKETKPQTQEAQGYIPTAEEEYIITEISKMVWGEIRGGTPEEWSLVSWTLFQRAGNDNEWTDCLMTEMNRKNAFTGYDPSNPVWPEIHERTRQDYISWKNGDDPPTHPIYAPTIPYYFFDGDSKNNYFREHWR